jgi:glycosyltransferase involved in cell wall biosynthesis
VRPALCSAGELFGGVERQLLDLCEYLGERGRPPLLLLFHDAELARQARERGIDPLVIQGKNRYDPGQSRLLAIALAAHDINVIHVHGYKAMIASALAVRWYPVGVLKTEHGLPEPTRGRPWRWLKSQLNRRLDGWATRRARATVCYVTADLRRRLSHLHRGLEQVTIPNGIKPLDRTRLLRPDELPADRFNVGIVGRIAPVKGIDLALDALAGQRLPERLRLVVIGTGPAAGQLEDQARRLALGERAVFLGFRHNIYDYLAHLDVLLMPSRHEGLPYALLEAMALGTPVAAARVGGLAEILEHERTALLFPPENPEAIGQTLARLAAEPELARRLGEEARQVQRDRYSLQAMGDAYWRLYLERVSGRAAAAGPAHGSEARGEWRQDGLDRRDEDARGSTRHAR